MPKRQFAKDIFDGQIHELQKAISTLEWDIPHMKNNELRAHKGWRLAELKNELKNLIEEKAALNGGRYNRTNRRG